MFKSNKKVQTLAMIVHISKSNSEPLAKLSSLHCIDVHSERNKTPVDVLNTQKSMLIKNVLLFSGIIDTFCETH
jgi:hypothetical protein